MLPRERAPLEWGATPSPDGKRPTLAGEADTRWGWRMTGGGGPAPRRSRDSINRSFFMSDRNSRPQSRGYRRRVFETMTAPALVLTLFIAGCGDRNEAGN